MTTTTDNPTVAYDEDGFEIESGTLCWVQTDGSVPVPVRNTRCLAVKADVGSQRWLLLIPKPKAEDPWSNASDVGWQLQHHITFDQMSRLNLNRFIDSHRGWWPGTGATFIERAVGHWCVDHQAFHATESCPPFDWAARVAQLEAEKADALERAVSAENALTQAKADVEQARIQGEQKLEDFKVKCSDILSEEANEHDLCGVYDEVAERAGLYPRTHDVDVEVEVTYRQTITVKARDFEAAAEIVSGKGTSSYYEPPSPFRDESDIEIGGTYSLNVSVVD